MDPLFQSAAWRADWAKEKEVIPAWALSVFAFIFLLVLSIASWGIKQAIGHVNGGLGQLGDKVGEVKATVNSIDKRLVRVETIIEEGRRPQRASSSMTPPPAA